MNILNYISTGKENAITRESLTAVTGLSDRKIRSLIEEERAKGNIIINLQNGKGYFLPREDETDVIESQYKINNARAMSVLAQQKYLRRRLKIAGVKV